MKEKSIIFNSEMVRAILDGRKTQTRRVVSRQPIYQNTAPIYGDYGIEWGGESLSAIPYPYGTVGDLLWVKETWAYLYHLIAPFVVYKSDYNGEEKIKWKSPVTMPREASRITLKITGVKVERLQDISEQDAIAEGVECEVYDNDKPVSACWYNYQENLFDGRFTSPEAIESFKTLWDSIYVEKHPWKSNPWVWVIEFKTC